MSELSDCRGARSVCRTGGGREAVFRSTQAWRPCNWRLPLLFPRHEVVKGLFGISVPKFPCL